jgi:endonuclease/exonuclease/phosphatase family metal-dependent hydrolase
MTWNLRSLRDDREAAIRVLRDCSPDVLCVQEAPRFLRARSRLAALARESGLVVAAGARPVAGVAVLTTMRVDVDAPRSVLLSKTPGLHRRAVALAGARVDERHFLAVSVHLGLREEERRQHADQILTAIGAQELPAVVAGDFNESPDGPARGKLSQNRRDAGRESGATFPAKRPSRRIDTIMVPVDWQVSVVSCDEICDESDLLVASDHRPVVVDVVG